MYTLAIEIKCICLYKKSLAIYHFLYNLYIHLPARKMPHIFFSMILAIPYTHYACFMDLIIVRLLAYLFLIYTISICSVIPLTKFHTIYSTLPWD